MGTGQNCTRLLNLHEGTKLHEDNFAPRVNFERVTILHEGRFLHESIKKNRKNNIEKNKKKVLKDKL